MRLSLADRAAAWILTLILAPLLFTAALPLISAGIHAYTDWPRFVRLVQSGAFFRDLDLLQVFAYVLVVFGTLPALVIGALAASVLDRLGAMRLAYTAAGFVLGLASGFVVLPVVFGAPVGDLGAAVMAGSYGALVALIYRTVTLSAERAHARRPGVPHQDQRSGQSNNLNAAG